MIINSDMKINTKTSKVYNFFILQVTFVVVKICWKRFSWNSFCHNSFSWNSFFFLEKVLFTSLILSYVITESQIILPKQLPFSQVHVLGLQLQFFSQIGIYFCSAFDLSYTFYHQIYTYICLIYALLIFLIYLALLSY